MRTPNHPEPIGGARRTARPQKYLAYLGTLLLAALLFGCGPEGREDPFTDLSPEERVQTAGATDGAIAPPTERRDSPEVAAAKARLPHQYRERPPLNLLDPVFNLNPNNNR